MTKTTTKPTIKSKVIALHRAGQTCDQIASALKIAKPYAYQIVWKYKKERYKPDAINPNHYKVGGIETIDFIEAKRLNYNLGNVVKYITRADHKANRLEDLQKAQWYLSREISNYPLAEVTLPKQG